jgi:hypothetical protein
LRNGSGRRPRARIDWETFLETFFWGVDFLLLAESYAGLSPDQKRMLDTNPELFGLVHGLKPALEGLRLTRMPSDGAAGSAP